MIPIDQTQLQGLTQNNEKETGNCFAACIASILEMRLEDVPNFCAYTNWEERLNIWLEKFGLTWLEMKLSYAEPNRINWGYHIVSGESLRYPTLNHAVVGLGDTMIHDPHPSKEGLKDFHSKDLEFGFFIAGKQRKTLVNNLSEIMKEQNKELGKILLRLSKPITDANEQNDIRRQLQRTIFETNEKRRGQTKN